MRAVAALGLILAACGQPAPPQQQPAEQAPAAEQAPSPEAAYAAALREETPADGQWFAQEREGTVAAGFGLPQSEYQFVVACEAGALSLQIERELMPDQPTTLRLITSTRLMDLAAHSYNEGLPAIIAEVAADAPEKAHLIGMLGQPQERFAVEAAGARTVFPWDESLARALAACGAA